MTVPLAVKVDHGVEQGAALVPEYHGVCSLGGGAGSMAVAAVGVQGSAQHWPDRGPGHEAAALGQYLSCMHTTTTTTTTTTTEASIRPMVSTRKSAR